MSAAGVRPQAEVAEVWPRDGALRLVGHVHGVPPRELPPDGSGGWRLLLVLRERPEHRLRRAPRWEGTRFEVSVPVADLVPPPAPGRPPAPEKWDLYLVQAPGRDGRRIRLRLGRHLDGIAGKKDIMVFPAQHVAGEGGGAAVRPFYTVNDNLSVKVRPEPAAPAGGPGKGARR